MARSPGATGPGALLLWRPISNDVTLEIPEAFAEYLPGRAMTGTSAPGHRGASISGVFSV